MEILGPNAALLKAVLDEATARQRVIAANIANVNTPGYRARDVGFDALLGRMVEKERENVLVREDGNSVVMEVEIGEMRKNALAYRTALIGLVHQARLMKAAIHGRQV